MAGKQAIGAELVTFFENLREAGFPEDAMDRLPEFGVTDPAVTALLKSGNTAMIEKYVGLQTPMIFWPPGAG